jgi:ACS family tartrate transporter-like MFS transporter
MAMLHDNLWVLAALSLATIGFYGMKARFWPLPSTFLTGAGLATGLALINSVGDFAEYLGPIVWVGQSPASAASRPGFARRPGPPPSRR